MTFVEVIWKSEERLENFVKLATLQRGAALAANGEAAAVHNVAVIEASFTGIHIHNLRKMGIIVFQNKSRYTAIER